jgi:DNA-directed RNA polymerase-3 subunit RPC5
MAYHEKLFIENPDAVPQLVSSMTNDQFLDSISAPRYDPVKKAKRKPLTRKQLVDLSKESDDEEEEEPHPPAKEREDDKMEVE